MNSIFGLLAILIRSFLVFIFKLKSGRRYILGFSFILISLFISLTYSPICGKVYSQSEFVLMIKSNNIYSGVVKVNFETMAKLGLYREVTTRITENGKERNIVTQPDRYYLGYLPDNKSIIVCDNNGNTQKVYTGFIETIPNDVLNRLPYNDREYLQYMLTANKFFARILLGIVMCVLIILGFLLLSNKATDKIQSMLNI